MTSSLALPSSAVDFESFYAGNGSNFTKFFEKSGFFGNPNFFLLVCTVGRAGTHDKLLPRHPQSISSRLTRRKIVFRFCEFFRKKRFQENKISFCSFCAMGTGGHSYKLCVIRSRFPVVLREENAFSEILRNFAKKRFRRKLKFLSCRLHCGTGGHS